MATLSLPEIGQLIVLFCDSAILINYLSTYPNWSKIAGKDAPINLILLIECYDVMIKEMCNTITKGKEKSPIG